MQKTTSARQLIEALGDIDGNGMVDLVVGARHDGDGSYIAGAVYVIYMETDGDVSSAQKISNQYGNFNSFYTMYSEHFGFSVTGLGDVDGDGVMDLAVGAPLDDGVNTDVGAVYLVNLQQTYCETPSPTAIPAPNPTATTVAATDDGTNTGTCYHHTSTVTRLAADGGSASQVALTDLKEGHRILALDEHATPVFATVEALPRGPSTEPFMHIMMTGKGNQGLKATLHHTFDTCASKRHPSTHAAESYATAVVMAKDIKAGDCLHTADGRRLVSSATLAVVEEGDVTYSIKLADGMSTVAIGGVFTHAMGHVKETHLSLISDKKKKYKIIKNVHLHLHHND